MGEPVLELSFDDTMHDRLRAVRAESATAIHDVSGAVCVLDHDEIERLSHEPVVTGVGLSFFDAMGIHEGSLRRWFGSTLFTNDGAAHERLRRVTASALDTPTLAQHRSFTTTLVRDRFALLLDSGVADLATLLADVPIRVMCRMLGLPDDDVAECLWHAQALGPVFGIMDAGQLRLATTAIDGLLAIVGRHVEARASVGEVTDGTRRDLIGAMVRGDGADRLDAAEVVDVVTHLLVGGHDANASQIGCTLLTALRHPALLGEVRDGRATLTHAVDESIRFEPSLVVLPRRLVTSHPVGGVERPAGTVVLLMVAAANRSDRWGDPDVVRPGRFAEPGVRHPLTFGVAPHVCLGAALARMTLEEVLAAYARIADRLVPIGDPNEMVWRWSLGRRPAAVLVSVR